MVKISSHLHHLNGSSEQFYMHLLWKSGGGEWDSYIRGAVSIIGWFWAPKSLTDWCIKTMSHGDVGVKNTFVHEKLFYLIFINA